MKLFKFISFIAIFLLFCQGCSTVMSQGPFTDRRYTKTSDIPLNSDTYPNIYSGVSTDYYMLKSAIDAEEDAVGGKGQALFFVGIYTVIDLPFSFVLDTILLPYTITRQILYGDIYNCYLVTKCSEIDSPEGSTFQ